jgi:hypothetical protein
MATLRIKRRRNTTKTINTETETQAKDRTAVNREVILSAAMKVNMSNEIMETTSDRRQGGSDRHNSRGRSSDNYHQGRGNQDRNRDNNRQDRHRQDNQNQDNGNSQRRYSTRYQERCRENETHQIDTDNESNDGQDTYILNQSNDNASDNEFYFADKKFHDTDKTNDEKENDEPVEDTDDQSMISYATEDNEDTEPMLQKTYQDALIPLQGELLNTEIVEPTVTLIPKQEIDYHPEIVLAIPKDPQAK